MIVVFVGYSRFKKCKGIVFAIYTSEFHRVNAANRVVAALSQILGIINTYQCGP